MSSAIDFIKNKRTYKRVYHDSEKWDIKSWYNDSLLIVDGRVVGSIDWFMTRQLEKEWFVWFKDVVDMTWESKKYHVLVTANCEKIREPELVTAVHLTIEEANREGP